jgi:hypothetical protein
METRVFERLCATGSFLLPSRGRLRLPIALIAIFASLGTTGCGPRRMRVDFIGYEKAYAETSNREVLLNLARLQQRDPTYFFKLGQISSSYRMQAGLTGFGQYVPQGASTGVEVPSGGGTPSGIYENDPSFTFIPVSDETNAKLLLNPVPEEVFYNLYLQGWRVDQLFRLMVDRIELTLPASGNKPCRVETIRNVPPPPYYGSDHQIDRHYTYSAKEWGRYVIFLRVSAIVYALQKRGALMLQSTTEPKQLEKLSAKSGDKVVPTANDFVSAAAADEEWVQQDSGQWTLTKKVSKYRFQLTLVKSNVVFKSKTSATPQPGAAPAAGATPKASAAPAAVAAAQAGASTGTAIAHENVFGENVSWIESDLRDEIAKDPSLKELADGAELTDILEILYNGFAIGGAKTGQDEDAGSCPASGSTASSHLVMRSLIGLMAAAAQEQEPFDQLTKEEQPIDLNDTLVLDVHKTLRDATGAAAEAPGYADRMSQEATAHTFSQLVPSIERLPVLQLIWPAGTKLPDPYTAVVYGHQTYAINDRPPTEDNPNNPFAQENQYWNRDMFRLICELASQVTVDISKFPLPEVLQLRTE